MIQEILTYAIVAWAFTKVGIGLWRMVCPSKTNTSSCGSGGCSSCEAKTDLVRDIKHGKFPRLLQDGIRP